MTWTRESIRAELVRVFQSHAHDGMVVGETSNLVADLGIDSLEVMEVIADLEDIFGLRIPDDALPQIRTVADVATAVESRLRKDGRLEGDGHVG